MKKILTSCLSLVCLAEVANANLLSNGSFESSPIGTASAFGPGGGIDATTFTDWRFFSVGSPAIDLFHGDIQDATFTTPVGTPGDHIFRFYVDRSPAGIAAGGIDYALDRDASKVGVVFGTSYTFSYDAVLYGSSGGGFPFLATLAEYGSGNNFLGSQTEFSPALVPGAWQSYSFAWSAVNPLTTQINISFRPVTEEGFINHVGLNNVELNVVPEPSTMALGLMSGLGLLALRRRRA
jgi:hypothetical protein